MVLDDLSTGARRRVPEDVELVEGTVLDRSLVVDVLRTYAISGVVHVAAKKAVGESWDRPLHYYRENVGGFASLLDAMEQVGIDRLVFSSSAAVYGMPDEPRVGEHSPTRPMSPYGRSKLACEWMLSDAATARPLHHVTLRYFNAAGAASPDLGDDCVVNLIPSVLAALESGRRPQIFGDDYPTPDGTCVRDYVHVQDVAQAHTVAVRRVAEAAKGGGASYAATFNLGRGVGASVKEVLAIAGEVTGRKVDAEVVERRSGDPATLVADVAAVEREWGWRASRDLADIVHDAWAAWTN